jgi:O-antigen/teichoic acid export membrane protein
LKRKFVTNLLLLIFLNLIIKIPYVFGIVREVIERVGAEEYGFFFPLFNLSVILNIFLDFGINNYNNRLIAQSHNLLSKYFSKIVVVKFFLAILYAVLCLAIGLVAGYSAPQFKMLFVLIFNQFLAGMILYFNTNISGLHKFKTYSVLSVIDRALMILLCGLLLGGYILKGDFTIWWFVFSQTITYSVTFIISLLIVSRNLSFFKPGFRLLWIYVIIKQTFPYALLIFLMFIYNRIDSVLMERLLPDGKEQAGIYAQSATIIDAINNYALQFAVLLLPIFARMIKKKLSVESLVHFSFLLLIVPAIVLSVNASFYRFEIIEVLYDDPHNQYSSGIFGILIINFILVSATYIFSTLLTANGSLKALNTIAGMGVLVNVVFNLLVIPRFRAQGAACVNLSTQVITCLAQVIYVIRLFKFRFNRKLLVKIVVFVALTIILAFYSKRIQLEWYYLFFGTMVLNMLVAFGLRLINLRHLIEIIKQRGKED